MNCFELVKSVLDETYHQIPAKNDKERDDLILQACSVLYGKYENLLSRSFTPIDYSPPHIRFAYIYTYVTAHANLVAQFIGENETLSTLFDQPSLKISCVGGGPGSDLLGMLKLLNSVKNPPRIHFYLLDKERAWDDSWSDISDKTGARDINVSFQNIDITNQATWQYCHKPFSQSDLFTMTYFLSEVYQINTTSFFQHMFSLVKKGAYFLYIDNNNQNFTSSFERLVNQNNLTILSKEPIKTRLPNDEQKWDLGEYYEKFPDPKIKSNVAVYICQKPF